MITDLDIRNFRHNERLNIKLDRITVFRGPSGSGKSSLLGALKWVFFNQPSGTNFIHWDHKFAAVKLIAGKHTITRRRGKSKNIYRMDGQRYVAFGASVPESIRTVLNVSNLNFQRQHAGPFWFRETAGEVSRQLNAIVNLELIDTTLANISKEQRETKTKIKLIDERVTEAEKEKKKLRWVVGFNKKLESLERDAEDYAKRVESVRLLVDLVDKGKQHQKAASQIIPDIKPLLKLLKQWRGAQTKYEQLTELFGRAEEYKEIVEQTDNGIKENERKLKRLMGERCPLCGNQLKTKT